MATCKLFSTTTDDERNKRHDGTEHTSADGALARATRDEGRLCWLRQTTGSGSGDGAGAASGEAGGDGASGGGVDGAGGSGGGLDGGGAGDDNDLAVGGGEDDLGNGDLGGDGGHGEGGLGGGAGGLTWDGDGGLDDDGGDGDGVGLLGRGRNSLGWAVGDDAGVGGHVWGADTLEELGGGVDLIVGGTEGGQALEELLGEVGLGAEAANVGVGLALSWEPGLDALGKDRWAGKTGVAAWGGGVGGLGRGDGGVGVGWHSDVGGSWLSTLGGSWLSTLGGSWLSTLSGSWLRDSLSGSLTSLLWARRLGAGALGAESLGGGEDNSRGGQGGLDGGEAGGDVGEGDWARGDGDVGDDGGQGNLGLSGGRGLHIGGLDGGGLDGGGGRGLYIGGLDGGGLYIGGLDGGSLDGGGLDGGGLDGGGGRGLHIGGLDGGGRRRSGLWCGRGGLDSWGSSGGGLDGAGRRGGGWAVKADAVDADVAAGLSSLGWLGVDDGDVLGATTLGVLNGGTGALALRLLLADRVVGEGVVELKLAVELYGHLEVGDGELVDRAGLDLGAAALVATYAEGPWEESVTPAATEGRLAAPSAGEVKSCVVIERSEVQVSPVEPTPLLRLTLVDGGLAGAREDRSVVPSLRCVRYRTE
ncbi:hypothetical protein V500_06541 [Pseudogymnoascus sp. VKM F-4518 (FW-2643)]|nr:hypothetical protein V500_06541 [Pseudogymnoascus sp. VKM F-4518 (FW-2643)]